MTALQRLELITRQCPPHLSELTALTKLTIGDLKPWNELASKQLEVGKGWQGICLHFYLVCTCYPCKL
jgi:hypothetical protein